MTPLPPFRHSSFNAFRRFSKPVTVTDEQYPLFRNILHVSPTAPSVRRVKMLDIYLQRVFGDDQEQKVVFNGEVRAKQQPGASLEYRIGINKRLRALTTSVEATFTYFPNNSPDSCLHCLCAR